MFALVIFVIFCCCFFSSRTERIDGGRLFLVVYLGSLLIQLPSPPLPGLAVCRWGQGLSDQGSGDTPRWENLGPHVFIHQSNAIPFYHTHDSGSLLCLPASLPWSCPMSYHKTYKINSFWWQAVTIAASCGRCSAYDWPALTLATPLCAWLSATCHN